jgi:hypothetical protein
MLPASSAQRTVACSDATLSQQEKSNWQMSKRTEYAAI